MAAEMFGCEFDRYDKKQRPCNLYTFVGVLMALLESIFSAANSFAGLVEAAIFVLDEPTRSAGPRCSPPCAARSPPARAALGKRSQHALNRLLASSTLGFE